MKQCRHQDGAGPTQTAIMRKGLLAPTALLALAPGALSPLSWAADTPLPHPDAFPAARLEVRLHALDARPAGEIPLLGIR